MNAIQALNFLAQVCEQAPLPKAGHVQVQAAIEVLNKAISEMEKKDEK